MTTVEIGLLCTVGGLLLAYLGYRLTTKKEDNSEGREAGTILTELGYIKSGIDDIKVEQKEQRKTNVEFSTRLAKVEASASQAHKRIDRIEGREERD